MLKTTDRSGQAGNQQGDLCNQKWHLCNQQWDLCNLEISTAFPNGNARTGFLVDAKGSIY
jgi:hypothetical protein